MADRERWLFYPPNVASVQFGDLKTLGHADRLCGSAITNSKQLNLSPWGADEPDEDNDRREFIKTERFGVCTLLNLTKFDSIESLVLLGMDHQNPRKAC